MEFLVDIILCQIVLSIDGIISISAKSERMLETLRRSGVCVERSGQCSSSHNTKPADAVSGALSFFPAPHLLPLFTVRVQRLLCTTTAGLASPRPGPQQLRGVQQHRGDQCSKPEGTGAGHTSPLKTKGGKTPRQMHTNV